MPGPAYHGRTHRRGGTDPIPPPPRASLYCTTEGTQSVLTQGWSNIEVRYTPMVVQSGEVIHDELGLELTGSPTGTTVAIPAGFYEFAWTASLTFPQPQVTAVRMVGLAVDGIGFGADLKTGDWGDRYALVPQNAVDTGGTNALVTGGVFLVNIPTADEFSLAAVEDEQASGYRCSSFIVAVSILRAGDES